MYKVIFRAFWREGHECYWICLFAQVGGLAEVYLTHASSSGIVYVQVETKTFKALDDLLKIAKSEYQSSCFDDWVLSPI